MNNIFQIPNKERNYQSYMVYVLSILWSATTGITVSIGFYAFPEIWTRWLIFLIIALFIGISNLTINSLGYSRAASWSLTLMLWLYITIPCYSAGGILAPGIISQMSVILTAGFLLGWRGGLMIGLLTVGVDFMFAYLEVTGYLPEPTVMHNPITRWLGAIIPFGTILSLQYYATNHLRTSLVALQQEILKREEAEKVKNEILHDLEERVKELRTLYLVGDLLRKNEVADERLFWEIVRVLPQGWQYPELTAVKISIAEKNYTSSNFSDTSYSLSAEAETNKGLKIEIQIVYLKSMPQANEGPFLKEERHLINMLIEMLKTHLEKQERADELRDYKFALDTAAIVSISTVDGCFSFVNENFEKVSKYSSSELLGRHHDLLWSGYHSPEYFDELTTAMKNGKAFRGRFCNRAKDGSLYWIDSTIVPFLNEEGTVYQYLSINQDITEHREAEEKIKQNEQLLRKITSQVPGNTYMFEIDDDGQPNVLFMNQGTNPFNHSINSEDSSLDPEKPWEIVHGDDQEKFKEAMEAARLAHVALSYQYKVVINGQTQWRWMQAVPEKEKSGKIVWYGATSDITPLVDYLTSIEQIIFDVAHVMRRPISTMLSLTKLISDTQLTESEIREYSTNFHHIAIEMDEFIRELNKAYQQKKELNQFNINVSSSIDKRDSLFS